jgi:hypothetical protein
MKIWQIEIGTEEGGENVEVVNGVAATAQDAIGKALVFAREEGGHKNPYPSRVTEIGEQLF